jgi:hypothetical protein
MDKKKAAIFEVINQWETARQSDAFPESAKPGLQDVNREFHLVTVGPGEWELQPVNPAGPAVRIKARPGLTGSIVPTGDHLAIATARQETRVNLIP